MPASSSTTEEQPPTQEAPDEAGAGQRRTRDSNSPAKSAFSAAEGAPRGAPYGQEVSRPEFIYRGLILPDLPGGADLSGADEEDDHVILVEPLALTIRRGMKERNDVLVICEYVTNLDAVRAAGQLEFLGERRERCGPPLVGACEGMPSRRVPDDVFVEEGRESVHVADGEGGVDRSERGEIRMISQRDLRGCALPGLRDDNAHARRERISACQVSASSRHSPRKPVDVQVLT